MSNKKIKLLLISGSLGGGGAERLLSHLTEYLDRNKYQIKLCLFEKSGSYLKGIPGNIPIFELCKGRKKTGLRLILAIRKIIQREKPDLIFSNLAGSNIKTVLALKTILGKKHKLVLGVQNAPSAYGKRGLKWIKFTYPAADILIPISSGIKQWLLDKINIPKEKIKVIHNSVDIDRVQRLAEESGNHKFFEQNAPVLISVGSLTIQKGYPYLLKALKEINKNFLCYLLILGQGPEKEKLEILANELNIKDKVDFLGFQINPFKYMAKADIFVLASLWEGFGNVIVEAMAVGTPVVVSDIPCGPRDIITNGYDGYLVQPQNPRILAEKIRFLLKNKEIKRKFSEQGLKKVRALFNVDKIVKEYDDIFFGMFKNKK